LSNEIIFDDRISRIILDLVNLLNCKFENLTFYKSEFCGCIFENCEILGSKAIKVDSDETIFRNCQFQRVNFEWS